MTLTSLLKHYFHSSGEWKSEEINGTNISYEASFIYSCISFHKHLVASSCELGISLGIGYKKIDKMERCLIS